MSNSQAKIDSESNALMENPGHIKEACGDEYPIIWYDTEIDNEDKRNLRNFIQGHRLISSFRSYSEALQFAQSLGISFIFIIPSDFDERRLVKDIDWKQTIHGRRMSKFEEERLFEDFIKETSDETIKRNKIYVFCTFLDCLAEVQSNSEEKDVTVIGNVNEMAEKFREEYTIILYDPDRNPEMNEIREILIQKLGIEIEETNIYAELSHLSNYSGPPYHLIVIGNYFQRIIFSDLGDLQDLLAIYIYGQGIPNVNRKVKAAITLEKLIPKIEQGIRTHSRLRNTFPAFATSFDALDRSHLYNLHHYLKGFVNFKNREQAKEDFIHLSRRIYQSSKLFAFKGEYTQYSRKSIFSWYTDESPIYKMINNCLRVASSDSILYCRFILKDLEQAIREQYQERSHSFNGLVYRAAHISPDEWEKLQRNTGQEIEMYGFLSTTEDQMLAFKYLKNMPRTKVLITIIIPPLPELDNQGFADLNEFTKFQRENEILFNVRSKFQILHTETIDFRGKEIRHLVLLFGAYLLRKFMRKNQSIISVELDLSSQEIIQCTLCESDFNLFGLRQAQIEVRCFDCLKKNFVPKNIPLIVLDGKDKKQIVTKFKGKLLEFTQKTPILPFFGYICCDCQKSEKENYYSWITQNSRILRQCSECFEKSKEVKSEILISESFPFTLWTDCQDEWERINKSYNVELPRREEELNEGEVYFEVQDFSRCVKYGNQVLDSLKSKRGREREKAKTFEMMGRAYQNLGKFHEALDCHLNALEIKKSLSQGSHPEIATSYNNIGLVLQNLGDYKAALGHHLQALDLRKSLYEGSHPEIATSYHYIATIYQLVENSEKALEHQDMALDIRRSAYGESHPETAKSYNNLALMYAKFKEFDKALEYHNKALEIFLSIYGKRHSEVASLYNNIGLVYQSKDENEEAMKWNKEALEIVRSIYGENHPRIGIAYSNIASTYERMGMNVAALDWHLKALGILRSFYDKNSPEMKTVYESIILGYKILGKFNKAEEYEAIVKMNKTEKDLGV